MKNFITNKIAKPTQFLLSAGFIIGVAVVCYGLYDYVGYHVVALILLFVVSLIAISFDILPVLLSAALSAFIWEFFFIPPRFRLQVSSAEDAILLTMYFVIAMVNAVMTYKVRQIEKVSMKKEEKANIIKLYDTFLNSLSHELRTPIATIIGATDNLQANNKYLTNDNKKQLLAEISKASLRLNQQVENLLNMSRLESGFLKPKRDWCDINEIVYEVVKKLEDNNVSQQIIVSIPQSLPLFKLDKIMLEQIIYNLLNNACVHNDLDCIVSISATNRENVLQIIVEDNGKGFPKEEIDNVFEKFYRLKNANKSGTGLGLSIVKGFTEALGGNVCLQNLLTGGATFKIEIASEASHLKAYHE